MFDNVISERVLLWILFLEEYGPTIEYINGPGNVAVDTLIRLLLINYDITYVKIIRETLGDSYCFYILDGGISPITYQNID